MTATLTERMGFSAMSSNELRPSLGCSAMTEITTADVERKVREFAALAPDYRYDTDPSGCSYVPDERNPLGCLMSAALRDLGFDITEDIQNACGAKSCDTTIPSMCQFLGIEGSTDWLDICQSLQDGGHSWSRCVAAADERMGR